MAAAQSNAAHKVGRSRPVPAYSLPAPLLATDPRLPITVPGLATAACLTVCMKVQSINPQRQNSFLLGVVASDGNYTNIACFYNGQLAQNTYGPGFWTQREYSLGDGVAHLVTVKLYPGQQDRKLAIYVDGELKELVDNLDASTGNQYGQYNRDFSNTLVVGDINGSRFEGTIYHFEAYPYDLPDATRRAVENSF